ncbi:MAG: DMT family transporter [Candidatus Diapherotrites archaeon]
MSDSKLAYAYLLLTIILWSGTPAAAKIALGELNDFQLLLYANLVGLISLSFAVLIQKKLHHFLEYKKSDYVKMFFMGVLGLFLYYVFLYESFTLAPAGQANIINYLWPIFVVIFSILLLKEKFNLKTITAILLSFFGALLIFTQGDLAAFANEYTFGYMLAAAAAVCYGLFSVLGKKVHFESYTSMLVYYLSSMIPVIVAVYLLGGIVLPAKIETIAAVIFLGGFANSLAFVFWFKALELGHTHRMANGVYAVPFLALAWTYLLNNEAISIISIAALVIIVSGILIQYKNKG